VLLLHELVLALGGGGIDDGVYQSLQSVVLVGRLDLVVGRSHLPHEYDGVFDVRDHLLQYLKMMRAASSNGPLLLRHDAHSESP
jgi:hypothetical protein